MGREAVAWRGLRGTYLGLRERSLLWRRRQSQLLAADRNARPDGQRNLFDGQNRDRGDKRHRRSVALHNAHSSDLRLHGLIVRFDRAAQSG
jgi:hypothetical protein